MSVAFHVGNKRLLKLAAFLRTLPRKRFDYGDWVGEDWKGKADLSCGTTACAMGWATTMPLFKRLGLKLAPSGTVVIDAKGQYDVGVYAAEKLFGITYEEAWHLFVPGRGERNATPKQVAKKIRQFVAERIKQRAKDKAKK